ncbi:transcriptional regulator [Thermoanaerobacterium sp. PSU-2]|uniref:ROK family protein n=1 Tax=Thermoanaerobacterium sp. PSU-2 TaxID=1930849 RepID=UPI000A147BD9|nr:ROK family protein [Thermoanaerobacterium sp. PSU-2]ORX23714.1 transcriptional regulator [Thermoanaerobacterium sp. PSU-2]HHV74186.1 ROK family protein [Thermoanaerobacterium sp.]
MKKFACGVDLGGTKINTGIMDEDGNILCNVKIPTEADKGPQHVIDNIKKSIIESLNKLNIDVSQIAGIGIGAPGPLNADRGVVECPPNLPGWIDIPLVDILKRDFDTEIKLNNDANVAALAEHLFGAGQGINNMVYMTVSTGIGGGAIIDGKLYNGANSNAAEIGHHTINFDGPRWCNCGNPGCLESYASGTSLVKFAKKHIESGKDTILKDKPLGELKAEDIFDAAKSGDKLSLELIENEAFYLGIGIVNIMAFYNPELIIIGGGLSSQWDVLYDKMMRTVDERALKPNRQICKVVKAKLGGNVGLIGAASLVL